jgi:hypothetical protein
MRGPKAWLGVLWIAWCALMFYATLGGVQTLFQHTAIARVCERECTDRGASFEHLRIGGRGGPPSACICSDREAIETSLPDLGVFISVLIFLPACWLPLWWVGRRAKARAPDTSR